MGLGGWRLLPVSFLLGGSRSLPALLGSDGAGRERLHLGKSPACLRAPGPAERLGGGAAGLSVLAVPPAGSHACRQQGGTHPCSPE